MKAPEDMLAQLREPHDSKLSFRTKIRSGSPYDLDGYLRYELSTDNSRFERQSGDFFLHRFLGNQSLHATRLHPL